MKRILNILLSIIIPLSVLSSKRAEHVIFIGIDGFSSSSLEYADLPTIQNLASCGSYTFKKRAVLPTASAPNWASMFMGVPTEIHGYTEWGSTQPDIQTPFFNLKNGIMPTIFQIVKEECPDYRVGCIYEWNGIKHLVDTISCDYHNLAEDCLDIPQRLTDMACDYIKQRPNLFAIIFDGADHAGHNFGYDSSEYISVLSFIDSEISRIIDAVKEAGILGSTVFVISSDHGGYGFNHGGITHEELETPFIIAGKGIKKGYEIPDIVMQYDVASVVLDIFDIEQPEYWRGKPVDIKDDANEGMTVEKIIPELSGDTATHYFDLQGRLYHHNTQNKKVIIKTTVSFDGTITSTKHIDLHK